MPITAPTSYEQSLWSQGKSFIAGIDEVGRGAWAGPMVIGAVIFPPNFSTDLPINDSKKLSPKLRTQLSSEIKKLAAAYAILEVDLPEINTLGIGVAGQLGFSRIISRLPLEPDHVLIDAFPIKGYPTHQQTAIVRGDSASLSIAAASIIAKVYRDNLMTELGLTQPQYQFHQNVGYGTKQHRDAIKKYGLSKLHRTSYDLTKWI